VNFGVVPWDEAAIMPDLLGGLQHKTSLAEMRGARAIERNALENVYR
jgi:hypothetical protein